MINYYRKSSICAFYGSLLLLFVKRFQITIIKTNNIEYGCLIRP